MAPVTERSVGTYRELTIQPSLPDISIGSRAENGLVKKVILKISKPLTIFSSTSICDKGIGHSEYSIRLEKKEEYISPVLLSSSCPHLCNPSRKFCKDGLRRINCGEKQERHEDNNKPKRDQVDDIEDQIEEEDEDYVDGEDSPVRFDYTCPIIDDNEEDEDICDRAVSEGQDVEKDEDAEENEDDEDECQENLEENRACNVRKEPLDEGEYASNECHEEESVEEGCNFRRSDENCECKHSQQEDVCPDCTAETQELQEEFPYLSKEELKTLCKKYKGYDLYPPDASQQSKEQCQDQEKYFEPKQPQNLLLRTKKECNEKETTVHYVEVCRGVNEETFCKCSECCYSRYGSNPAGKDKYKEDVEITCRKPDQNEKNAKSTKNVDFNTRLVEPIYNRKKQRNFSCELNLNDFSSSRNGFSCDSICYDEKYISANEKEACGKEKQQWFANGKMPLNPCVAFSVEKEDRAFFNFEQKYKDLPFCGSNVSKDEEYWSAKNAQGLKADEINIEYESNCICRNQFWHAENISSKSKIMKSMGDSSFSSNIDNVHPIQDPRYKQNQSAKPYLKSLYTETLLKTRLESGDTNRKLEGKFPLYLHINSNHCNSNNSENESRDEEKDANTVLSGEDKVDVNTSNDIDENNVIETNSDQFTQSNSSDDDVFLSPSEKDRVQMKYSAYGQDSFCSDENLYFENKPDVCQQLVFHALPEEVCNGNDALWLTDYHEETFQPTVLHEESSGPSSSSISCDDKDGRLTVDEILPPSLTSNVKMCENYIEPQSNPRSPTETIKDIEGGALKLTFFEKCKQTLHSLAKRTVQSDMEYEFETIENRVVCASGDQDVFKVVKNESGNEPKPRNALLKKEGVVKNHMNNSYQDSTSRAEVCPPQKVSSLFFNEPHTAGTSMPDENESSDKEWGSSVDSKLFNESGDSFLKNESQKKKIISTNNGILNTSCHHNQDSQSDFIEPSFLPSFYDDSSKDTNHANFQNTEKTPLNLVLEDFKMPQVSVPAFLKPVGLKTVAVSCQNNAPSKKWSETGKGLDGLNKYYSEDIKKPTRAKNINGDERYECKDSEACYSSMYQEKEQHPSNMPTLSSVFETMQCDSEESVLLGPTLLLHDNHSKSQVAIYHNTNRVKMENESSGYKGPWHKSISSRRVPVICSQKMPTDMTTHSGLKSDENDSHHSALRQRQQSSALDSIGNVGKDIMKGFWFFGSKAAMSDLFDADSGKKQLAESKPKSSFINSDTTETPISASVKSEETPKLKPTFIKSSFIKLDETTKLRPAFIKSDEMPKPKPAFIKSDETPKSKPAFIKLHETLKPKLAFIKSDETPKPKTAFIKSDEASNPESDFIKFDETSKSKSAFIKSQEMSKPKPAFFKSHETPKPKSLIFKSDETTKHTLFFLKSDETPKSKSAYVKSDEKKSVAKNLKFLAKAHESSELPSKPMIMKGKEIPKPPSQTGPTESSSNFEKYKKGSSVFGHHLTETVKPSFMSGRAKSEGRKEHVPIFKSSNKGGTVQAMPKRPNFPSDLKAVSDVKKQSIMSLSPKPKYLRYDLSPSENKTKLTQSDTKIKEDSKMSTRFIEKNIHSNIQLPPSDKADKEIAHKETLDQKPPPTSLRNSVIDPKQLSGHQAERLSPPRGRGVVVSPFIRPTVLHRQPSKTRMRKKNERGNKVPESSIQANDETISASDQSSSQLSTQVAQITSPEDIKPSLPKPSRWGPLSPKPRSVLSPNKSEVGPSHTKTESIGDSSLNKALSPAPSTTTQDQENPPTEKLPAFSQVNSLSSGKVKRKRSLSSSRKKSSRHMRKRKSPSRSALNSPGMTSSTETSRDTSKTEILNQNEANETDSLLTSEKNIVPQASPAFKFKSQQPLNEPAIHKSAVAEEKTEKKTSPKAVSQHTENKKSSLPFLKKSKELGATPSQSKTAMPSQTKNQKTTTDEKITLLSPPKAPSMQKEKTASEVISTGSRDLTPTASLNLYEAALKNTPVTTSEKYYLKTPSSEPSNGMSSQLQNKLTNQTSFTSMKDSKTNQKTVAPILAPFRRKSKNESQSELAKKERSETSPTQYQVKIARKSLSGDFRQPETKTSPFYRPNSPTLTSPKSQNISKHPVEQYSKREYGERTSPNNLEKLRPVIISKPGLKQSLTTSASHEKIKSSPSRIKVETVRGRVVTKEFDLDKSSRNEGSKLNSSESKTYDQVMPPQRSPRTNRSQVWEENGKQAGLSRIKNSLAQEPTLAPASSKPNEKRIIKVPHVTITKGNRSRFYNNYYQHTKRNTTKRSMKLLSHSKELSFTKQPGATRILHKASSHNAKRNRSTSSIPKPTQSRSSHKPDNIRRMSSTERRNGSKSYTVGRSSNDRYDVRIRAGSTTSVREEVKKPRRESSVTRKVSESYLNKKTAQNSAFMEVVKMGADESYNSTRGRSRGGLAYKIEQSDDPERPLIKKMISPSSSTRPKKKPSGPKKLYKTYGQPKVKEAASGTSIRNNQASVKRMWSGVIVKNGTKSSPSKTKFTYPSRVSSKETITKTSEKFVNKNKQKNSKSIGSQHASGRSSKKDAKTHFDRFEKLSKDYHLAEGTDNHKLSSKSLHLIDSFTRENASIDRAKIKHVPDYDKKYCSQQNPEADKEIATPIKAETIKQRVALSRDYKEYRDAVQVQVPTLKEETSQKTSRPEYFRSRSISATENLTKVRGKRPNFPNSMEADEKEKPGLITSFVNCLNPFKMAAYKRQQLQISDKNENNNSNEISDFRENPHVDENINWAVISRGVPDYEKKYCSQEKSEPDIEKATPVKAETPKKSVALPWDYKEYRDAIQLQVPVLDEGTQQKTLRPQYLNAKESRSLLVTENVSKVGKKRANFPNLITANEKEKPGLITTFINCLNPFKMVNYKRQQLDSENENNNSSEVISNDFTNKYTYFPKLQRCNNCELGKSRQSANKDRRRRIREDYFNYSNNSPWLHRHSKPKNRPIFVDQINYRRISSSESCGPDGEHGHRSKSLNEIVSNDSLYKRIESSVKSGDNVLDVLRKLVEWNVIVLLVNFIVVFLTLCPATQLKLFSCPLPSICNIFKKRILMPLGIKDLISPWNNATGVPITKSFSPDGNCGIVFTFLYNIARRFIEAIVVFCKYFLFPAVQALLAVSMWLFVIIYGELLHLLTSTLRFVSTGCSSITDQTVQHASIEDSTESSIAAVRLEDKHTEIRAQEFSPGSVDKISSDLDNLRHHGSFFFYFGFDNPKEGCDFSYLTIAWKLLTGSFPTECM